LIKFSISGDLLAVAFQSGQILILEFKLDMEFHTDRERVVARLPQPHNKERVSAFCWDPKGHRLFSADESGNVHMTGLHLVEPTISLSGLRSLFQRDKVKQPQQHQELVWELQEGASRSIGKVDSKVVQLDVSSELLLVSSLSRVVVFELNQQASPVPKQVGKALRQGPYGACFDPRSAGRHLLAARPGKRVWLADAISAEVQSTLKLTFSQAPSLLFPCSEFDCGKADHAS
jgi:hypothetical protein